MWVDGEVTFSVIDANLHEKAVQSTELTITHRYEAWVQTFRKKKVGRKVALR